MAFGYGVEDDEAWATLLEEKLPDSRVINLGLIGGRPNNTSGSTRRSDKLCSQVSSCSVSSPATT
jgi:hypothetical protein